MESDIKDAANQDCKNRCIELISKKVWSKMKEKVFRRRS